MKTSKPLLAAALVLLATGTPAFATVRYVDLNSASPTPPYTNWAKAAHVIQDAVDVAVVGDEIVVTNGIYGTGGRAVHGTFTNRVAVTRPLIVRSVNGPQFTIIKGSQTGGPSGEGAIRGAYLTNGAMLAGFTLTNGSTQIGGDYAIQVGGGVYCESTAAVVSNCVLVGNLTYQDGGGAFSGTLTDCVLTDNRAINGGGASHATLINCTLTGNSATVNNGGGAYFSTLTNCTLTGNSAAFGGGTYSGVLNNCTLTGNSASGLFSGGGGAYDGTLNNCTLSGNQANYGGGVEGGTLNNCTLSDNSAGSGGGAFYGTLNNCTLTGNSAFDGGGAYAGTLNNCTFSGNSVNGAGGGAYVGTLKNCTLTGNSAMSYGGGVVGGTLTNCIVYYNTAPTYANHYEGTLSYSCTTPLPASGSGNLDLEPQLANASHLSASSPCIGQGTYASVSGVDIDGEPWANPPSIGCDEIYSGSVTGALTVALLASHTNVIAGFSVDFQALISGKVTTSRLEFGDGTVASNRPYASHAWSATGDFPVILRAYNESYPAGVTATVTVHVVTQPVHHVAVGNLTPVPPYSSWATAAGNIQDAVDAASVPGALVLVTNGVYQSGGNTAGRVVADKSVAIQSVNGPQFTVISGGGMVRCVYLTNGTLLSGFTLTNGVADNSGGGVAFSGLYSDAVVSNCVIVGNSAANDGGGAGYVFITGGEIPQGGVLNNCTLAGNSAGAGGGTAWATLNNCTLTDNSADYYGGGAYGATLNNCTLTGNSADYSGGGANFGTLNKCMIIGNSAGSSGGGASEATLNNCTLTGNSARDYGGGAVYGTLNNCSLSGNRATYGNGGGAFVATLNNCTLAGNSAYFGSGGIVQCTLTNCIVYHNIAPADANYDNFSTFEYSCTTPLPSSGVGNLDLEPELASASHLSANSPCIGQGRYASISGVDIDGEMWANPPSIGCDEFYIGSATGTLAVAVLASYTNVAAGFSVELQGSISGRASSSRWEFGDGTVVSNRPFASHAWSVAGDYSVVLRAYNESNPAGVTATIMVHVVTAMHYVALNSASPTPPYSSWATAATNIQDAVDAVSALGAQVLVTNGVYQTGGRPVHGTMTNRVAVDKLLTLRSVNGPQFTFIQGHQVPGSRNGDGAIRCVYLTNGATLSGFTLTNGATRTNGDNYLEQSGGGLWSEFPNAIVSNCVAAGNSAYWVGGGSYRGGLHNCMLRGNAGSYGGGVYGGMLTDCTLTGNSAASAGGASGSTLNNCTLSSNWATNYGGGAEGGTLNSCTLTNNSAHFGGGANQCRLNNCTLAGNSADYSGGGASYSTLNHCTIMGNSADFSGGGAYAGTLNHCTIKGNSAQFGGGLFMDPGRADNCTITGNTAYWAGGAYAGRLNNCTLGGNWADYGGGAYYSTLTNCTITGNSADYGGGAYYSALKNCIVFFNTATVGENYWNSTLNYCCTTPRPFVGVGNITHDPLFADYAGGSLRLQSNSPCINAGNNAYTPAGSDLDGNPRIAGGTVDIGAYEFQSPDSIISYAWLQQYGLPTDGSADDWDSDSDLMNNWQEWIAGTLPTDAVSVLRLLNPSNDVSGFTVSWQSVSNRTYFLERANNLGAQPSFSLLTSNIVGQTGTTSYTDTNAIGTNPFFYRVGVQP